MGEGRFVRSGLGFGLGFVHPSLGLGPSWGYVDPS